MHAVIVKVTINDVDASSSVLQEKDGARGQAGLQGFVAGVLDAQGRLGDAP